MKKLAIVGLGKWGKNLVREFSKISNVIICSSNGKKENIQWLTKEYPNIKYAKNIQELLQSKSIDAIVIATPIKTHFSLSHLVLESNKHVFIEKTISENSKMGEKLITLAKNKNLEIFVGHIFLYHPILKKLKEINKYEPITYLKMNWMRSDSFNEDILLELVSHFLSISIELLGTPKSIKVLNWKKNISSCDIITIELTFTANKKCILDINRLSNFKKRVITIITKQNTFEWEDDLLYKFNKKKQLFELILKSKLTPLEIECKTFIKNLNKTPDYSNSKKALKIIQLVEKCRDKMK
jgi:UDP-2-acetamido-3-amino-2,3-dideoxy-glucuronate N-acetyltransferase